MDDMRPNVGGVPVAFDFDGAHSALPDDATMRALGALGWSFDDWMRLSALCRRMAWSTGRGWVDATDFARVTGWKGSVDGMSVTLHVLTDDGRTLDARIPFTERATVPASDGADWVRFLGHLTDFADWGSLDETAEDVLLWLEGGDCGDFSAWQAFTPDPAERLWAASHEERVACYEALDCMETGGLL